MFCRASNQCRQIFAVAWIMAPLDARHQNPLIMLSKASGKPCRLKPWCTLLLEGFGYQTGFAAWRWPDFAWSAYSLRVNALSPANSYTLPAVDVTVSTTARRGRRRSARFCWPQKFCLHLHCLVPHRASSVPYRLFPLLFVFRVTSHLRVIHGGTPDSAN